MSDFNIMESSKQIGILAEKGVLLAKRQEGCFAINLFQIDGFYAEIYCHVGQCRIKMIRCFKESSGIDYYLEDIDISGLIG